MSILSKYDLFIFDWDHTLTDSTLFITMVYLLTKRNRQKIASRHIKKNLKPGVVKNIKIQEKENKLYSVLDDTYALIFKPKLKDDAASLLGFLKSKRKKVAIFSDSRSYRLLQETRALGVLKYVDIALSAESIGYFKPNPIGLMVLQDKFRVPKNKCLYIGDMASDVLTARLAGIDSCVIADGIDSYDMLKGVGAEHIFRNLQDFLRAIRN